MTSKATPGPWVIMNDLDVCTPEGNWIARCGESRFLEESEAEANLRLIAAAPEMLEALKDFVGYYPAGINPNLDSAAGAARAAIAKAEGGQ